MFCADKFVDLVLKSGANQYIEFKGVDASFVYNKDGKLTSVPDSRVAIFKDKSLGLTEKNQLMRFFKLVQQHLDDEGGENEIGNSRISKQDLESPFVDFLNKMRLPPKIKLYTWRNIKKYQLTILATSKFHIIRKNKKMSQL